MKKALILICMGCVLLSGCGSDAESKETTTKTTTTTTAKAVDSLGDQTTTTTKKIDGAIIIGDNTEASQTTTTIVEDVDPVQSEEVTTTTTVVTTSKVEEIKPAGSFSASDGVIELNSVKIKPDADFSSIKSSLGAPDEEYSSPSCLYDGDDKTFIYGDVTIYTYPSGSKDKVLEVEVMGGNAKTSKGLKLGSTIDEVEAMYGASNYDGYSCEYTDGGVTLYVQLENDVVVGFGVFVN